MRAGARPPPSSLFRSRRPPERLRSRAPPLVLEPALARLRGRSRGYPPPRDSERLTELFDEALDRQLAVPRLAALVLRHRPEDGAGACNDPAALGVGQRGGGLDLERRLDSGRGLLGVLASRAARPRDADLDLREREEDRARHPYRLVLHASKPARRTGDGREGVDRAALGD